MKNCTLCGRKNRNAVCFTCTMKLRDLMCTIKHRNIDLLEQMHEHSSKPERYSKPYKKEFLG